MALARGGRMDHLRYIDERFERLVAELAKLPVAERARVLDVVAALHAIKLERARRRDYAPPSIPDLNIPASPPAGPSTYTPPAPYPIPTQPLKGE
jgi:hypothetical protein